MKNNKITVFATIAALMTQIIFGFSFMFTKIALGFASPLTVIADRYILAFVLLTAIMLCTKTRIKFNKNTIKVIIMSLFQPVLYFIFETYGIKLTTSGFSAVMIALIPLVSMAGGMFVLGEIPSPLQFLFTGLTVCGVVIMSFAGNSEGTVSLLGVLFLLGAVVSSAAYVITTRKLANEFTAFERTYIMTLVGMVSFVIIAFLENIHSPIDIITPFKSIPYTLSLLYLGIISSVAAFFLLNFASNHLPVAKTTAFSNITTVVSVVAGTLFLKEKFTIWAAVSTVMIIIGVWGVQRIDVKNKTGK